MNARERRYARRHAGEAFGATPYVEPPRPNEFRVKPGDFVRLAPTGYGVLETGFSHVPDEQMLPGFVSSSPIKDTPMPQPTAKLPIVVRLTPNIIEFADQDAAIREATRLATKEQDEFIVYAPVARVFPKSEVTVEKV